jgi:4-carboxymuconolactone decarboxylase
VQKAISGEVIDEMYDQSPEDQLHIQRFLSSNCFCGVESQIKGHVRGNLNVGNGTNIDGVPDGYRAMNEREALKVMIEF